MSTQLLKDEIQDQIAKKNKAIKGYNMREK